MAWDRAHTQESLLFIAPFFYGALDTVAPTPVTPSSIEQKLQASQQEVS